MNTGTFLTEGGEILNLIPVSQVGLTPVYRLINERKPKPPVEILEGGPNGPVEIPNEFHSDYLAELEIYNQKFLSVFLAATIENGVDLDLTTEQQELVEKTRKKREKASPGLIENSFDIYIYVSLICPTFPELRRLSDAIEALNRPTARMVQDEVGTFRSDVPGRTDNENQDAPERSAVAVG